jgi:glycosyltransferase involved in cell wall biosynthesis
MSSKKQCIYILCPYPKNTIGSQRFRFEQYLDELNSIARIKQFPFWSINAMKILYAKGKKTQKALHTLIGLSKRFFLLPMLIRANVIFIHRESIPLGHGYYEWIISKVLRKKIVFDFDDAIWLSQTSKENAKIGWLKGKDKTSKICNLSCLVVCGNAYLEEYAMRFNSNTIIIPTTLDTDYHKPKENKLATEKIVIGWTGSPTTIDHFKIIIPVLEQLKNEYGERIQFSVIGDNRYTHPELSISGQAWRLETEIQDLMKFDIGIMPLPDDEWTKGKCGFKGLQYMSLEVPTVMSPVGVNTEIIDHGTNGFLANTDEEWYTILSELIENEKLRHKIGKEGRKTIINQYSISANKNKYASLF